MLRLPKGRVDTLFGFVLPDLLAGRRGRFSDRIKDRSFLDLVLSPGHRLRLYSRSSNPLNLNGIDNFQHISEYNSQSRCSSPIPFAVRMQRYRGDISRHRRPFWFPASNYYVLSVSVAVAFFFLVWGVLNDGQESHTPWIPAGVGAALVLGSAVIIREVILRNARERFLISQRKIDHSVKGIARRVHERDPAKLTLERNTAILQEIGRKSEAAKVLGRFSEGHREVFDLCSEYLAKVERELPNVGVGSPRIAALRRGTEVAGRYHHYHMLQWAEIESRTLTQEAQSHDKIAAKLESAQAAVGVLEFALRFYPQEIALLDSRKVLLELISSVKIADLIEKAERAVFKGNEKRALSLYQDALFLVGRQESDIQLGTVEHLNREIARLRDVIGKA
jgi:hypothetical protein